MKNILTMPVNYLRIYPTPIERESAVNKTKSLRVGALILASNLPKSEDGEDSGNNVIEFTAKQLNNLATIAKLNGVGEQTWRDLSILVGTMESRAIISISFHKKGGTYVDANGAEAKFIMDGYNASVDSIVLPKEVTNAFRQGVMTRQLNWSGSASELKDMFQVSEPVLEVK